MVLASNKSKTIPSFSLQKSQSPQLHPNPPPPLGPHFTVIFALNCFESKFQIKMGKLNELHVVWVTVKENGLKKKKD